MKKIYTLTISVLLITGSLYSQQTKNELYGSYGFASAQEISSILNDIILLPFVGSDFDIKSSVGPVIFGYRRNMSNHFSLGLTGSYTSFDKEYTLLNSQDAKFRVENTFLTGMLNANFCFNPQNMVQLYSGLSLGVSAFTQKDSIETDNSTLFAFHVNALGIRAGKSFGGFVEFGFGYNGIISAGLTVKF